MMSREGGFDRERILEWLQSIDLNQPSSEPDRGSPFDPDPAPQASAPPAAPSSQPQQQQLRQTQHKRHTSPLLLRLPTPVISLPQLVTTGALSLGSLPVAEATISGGKSDVTSSQVKGHLMSLRSRKKSDSPLPEVSSAPELPTFVPQTPIPPGSRTQIKPRQIPIPIPSQSGLGTFKLSYPTTLHTEIDPLSPSPHQEAVEETPVTETMTSALTPLVEGSCQTELILQASREGNSGKLKTALTFDKGDDEAVSHGADVSSNAAGKLPSPSMQTSNPAPSTSNGNQVSFTLAPMASGLEYEEEHEGEREGEREGEVEEKEREGEVEEKERVGEREREMCAPLSDIELAILSLQVVDILPQLAVCLCMEYSEYEHITRNEPSPQRQSMAVLMAWFRSGEDHSRREMAHTLERFGDKYRSLAQLLLSGQLEESRHPSLLERVSLPEKPVPSSISPTPAPLAHHDPPPLPPPLTTHLSPEHKRRPVSPSLSSLSAQARKLKQGFTFDEERRSSDLLPKFLSSRSLLTLSSSDSPQSHLQSESWPVQRRFSLSDSQTASSLLTASGFSDYPEARPSSRHRKSSLQPHRLIQTGGGSRPYLGRYRYGDKPSLQSEDPSGVLLEQDYDEYTPKEGVETEQIMAGSVETGRTRLGALKFTDSPQSSPAPLRPQYHLLTDPLSRRPHLSPAGGHIARDTRSHMSRGHGSRRRINRQDSGIETLVSNSSALP